MRNNAKLRGVQTLYDRFCSRLSKEEIDQKVADGVPHTIRLKVPEGSTTLEDLVVGRVTFNNNFIDDQVLLKSDKFPTYHLANVVDDYHMKISHVIRGEEWLPSTPKHLILYQAFGWPAPKFIHLPLLLNPDRSKMSKRQGDVSVDWYREQGYLPQGMLNFVALLGWNPGAGDNTELFFMDQLIAKFTLEHINKGGAVVNRNKLDWINTEHIKLLARDNMDQLMELFKVIMLKNLGGEYQIDAKLLRSVLKAACFVDRFSTLPELYIRVVYFFVRPNLTSFDAEHFRKSMHRPHTAAVVQLLIDELSKAEKWDRSVTLEIVTAVSKSKKPRGMRKPDPFHAVRYSLTGRRDGLETQLIMELLGKDETIERLKLALAYLEAHPVEVTDEK
jgi:glutamyl-tRNA synthetase